MIDYQTFHQIRHLHEQEHLTVAQIARQLDLHRQTVAKWMARPKYQRRAQPKRKSKLDPFKSTVARLLAQHPFTAQQVFQR
jgi:IS30 family transposase